MLKKSLSHPFLKTSFLSVPLIAVLVSGCTVSANNEIKVSAEKVSTQTLTAIEKKDASQNLTKNSLSKSKIKITEGSPADTVRIFYKNLRERRFREAMMMTNLRAAVEKLTDEEMKDFSGDFELLAANVPDELEINGEIVSEKSATVTAKMPDDNGKVGVKEIFLRREPNSWTLLTATEKEENLAKKQGKNYFFILRIETHHSEVETAMQDIAKAQIAYAIKNGGSFTDMQTLIAENYLSADVQNVNSIGYKFSVVPSADRKKYSATAEPEVYGKTGKLSFLLEAESSAQKPKLKSADSKGMPLKK